MGAPSPTEVTTHSLSMSRQGKVPPKYRLDRSVIKRLAGRRGSGEARAELVCPGGAGGGVGCKFSGRDLKRGKTELVAVYTL